MRKQIDSALTELTKSKGQSRDDAVHRARALGKRHAFSNVRKVLKSAQPHVKQWADVPNKWFSIGDGLGETYRRARDAFFEAQKDPQIEKLHEWRKQAKYLRYQLEILEPLWPERLEELAGEADTMGRLLGDDHDLTLLRQMLTSDPSQFGDRADVELLFALIEHRQTQLRRQATVLAERFFAEPSADFTRRLKGYWRTWRDQSRSQKGEELNAAVA